MKKRLLSLLLAVAVVMTYAASAFAATPADVKGTDYQSAVEELAALGVLNGYPDGTFKPTNTITRAELAKVVVVASGNESAATLMAKVKPTFKDVKANQWFTGFVNVAATKGLIKGDAGTKNFRPNDKIKFEEVVAVLIRSLGYQDSKLTGAWPYNVILKAQDIGLLDGIDITTGTLATRGVVALLTSATVNSPLVSYNADGIEVVSSTKLVAKIGSTSEAVLSNEALNANKQVELNGLPVNTADGFIVTGGKTLADLVGHTVTVTKKNGKVIALSDAQSANNIVSITTAATPATQTVSYGNYSITGDNNVSYQFPAAPTSTNPTYLGYKVDFVTKAPGSTIATGTVATLFLNKDGQVQFVNVVNYKNNATVASVEAKTAYRSARLNFKDGQGSVFVADGASVTVNGVAAAVSDIKEFDVVRYVTNGTAAVKVEVTRNSVTGSLTSKYTTGAAYYVTIAGKEYKFVNPAIVGAAGINTTNFGNLTAGTEYTAYLNKDGEVAYATAKNAALSSNYGVVLEVTHHMSAVVNGEVVIGDNLSTGATKLVYFSVKDNKNVTVYLDQSKYTNAASVGVGAVVKLKFNADGTLATPANGGLATTATTNQLSVIDITSTSIKVGTGGTSATYALNSNTVVVDGTGAANKVAVLTDLSKVHVGDTVQVTPNADSPTTADVVVVNLFSSGTSAAQYGLFVSRNTIESATGTTYSATLLVNGETKTYTIDSGSWTNLATAQGDYNNDPVNHTNRHVVKISGVTADDLTTNAATHSVADASNSVTIDSTVQKTFTTNDGRNWIASNNTAIYVVGANGTVYVGSFTDVNDAAQRLGAGLNQFEFVVTDTTVRYGATGLLREAAAIVINKH